MADSQDIIETFDRRARRREERRAFFVNAATAVAGAGAFAYASAEAEAPHPAVKAETEICMTCLCSDSGSN